MKKQRHSRSEGFILIAGTFLILFTAVALFTRGAIVPWLDLSSTGEIGDTIGGITAPFVGLLGAVLVYYSFRAQVKANRIQNKRFNKQKKSEEKAKNFEVFLRQYEYLQRACERFEYADRKGYAALSLFHIELKEKKEDLTIQEEFVMVLLNISLELNILLNVMKQGKFTEQDARWAKYSMYTFYTNWLEGIVKFLQTSRSLNKPDRSNFFEEMEKEFDRIVAEIGEGYFFKGE